MKIAAAILAGGRSTRMGSDKASLLWCGDALWRHQVKTLQEAGFQEIWISCRREQASTFGTEFPVIFDAPETSGPLSGITRVLEKTGRSAAILGVDMPYVSGELLARLLESSEGGSMSVVYQQKGYFEPLCAIYAASSLTVFQDLERQGVKRLQELWQNLVSKGEAKVLLPEATELKAFENLNTTEQWKQHQS